MLLRSDTFRPSLQAKNGQAPSDCLWHIPPSVLRKNASSAFESSSRLLLQSIPSAGGMKVPRLFLAGSAGACLVAAVLHAPAFRYELISDDEAIYDAMAQVVTRGGVMYRDTVDHKPPGLVYSYAAVRSAFEHFGASFSEVMAGVHLVGLLVTVATCAVLYRVGRYVLAERLWPWPPLLYALVSASNQPPDSLAVNGELLMNLPTVLAIWFALAAVSRKNPSRLLLYVAAGAMCGLAALYKYQAALVGGALMVLPVAGKGGTGASSDLRAWGSPHGRSCPSVRTGRSLLLAPRCPR